MKVQNLIRAKVATKGWQVKDFVKRTGIPPGTYYHRMRDSMTMTLEDIQRMDKILRFTDEELLQIVRGK